MKITKVNLLKLELTKSNKNLLALASVVLDDEFVIKGFKIVQGNKSEPFISFPSEKLKDGYDDIAFPITKECREYFIDSIFDEYFKEEKEEPKKSRRR